LSPRVILLFLQASDGACCCQVNRFAGFSKPSRFALAQYRLEKRLSAILCWFDLTYWDFH
jgi:hypothetical protein